MYFFPKSDSIIYNLYMTTTTTKPSPFFLLKFFMEQQHTARSRVIKSHLITTYNFRPILDNKDIKNSNKQKLTPNFDGYETSSSRKRVKKIDLFFQKLLRILENESLYL